MMAKFAFYRCQAGWGGLMLALALAAAGRAAAAADPPDTAATLIGHWGGMLEAHGSRAPGLAGNRAIETRVAQQFAESGFEHGLLRFEAPVFIPGDVRMRLPDGAEERLLPMHPTLMRPGNFSEPSFDAPLVYLGMGRPEDLERARGQALSGSLAVMEFACGNRWLDLLRETVRGSGVTLRWHSTNHLRYLRGSPEELARDGIEIPPGPPLPDAGVVAALRRTAFVVVPTGVLDDQDDRPFIARLSLPSRIPFILATTHTPFLVVGDHMTGAARFVRELGVGLVCPYRRKAFQRAVEELTQPGANTGFRRRALAWAGRFNDAGAAEWIWRSLERGEPFDLRYEDLMRKPRPEIEELVRNMLPAGGGGGTAQ